MTRSVLENAQLLEAIAGPDGMDGRQPLAMPADSLAFSSKLATFLSEASSDQPLQGFKIGVLKEGFGHSVSHPSVDKAVHEAAAGLAKLGAQVVEVSIPEHHDICTTWMCTLPYAGGRDGLVGDRTGTKELYMTDRAATKSGPTISQARFDTWGAGAKNLYMRYLYVADTYGPMLHAKAANLIRKQTRAYDAALSALDALVMPTTPFPARPSFPQDGGAGVLERLQHMAGMVLNTAPFNSTGHPALSLPVGFVTSLDDESIKLPTAMQIVGKQFDDLTCLKIAAAWERANGWKELYFGS